MQYSVYRNTGNSRVYPYLLDVQSDIIGALNTRLVIPLFPMTLFHGTPAKTLNPILSIEGDNFVLMTHEMASVRLTHLGEEVLSVHEYRQVIKSALDFLLDGF
ncbi:CcdB family protein [Rahnella sp. BCC 1045]|uniref:CcdB family protein n=1 Tax=Rahnella sp. BCC 1045 TaxID=2816251 RepID=UPI001C25993B|nr:CcdB family protein [Rahnella sp. BCC 1045]MBU9819653.1 CcdB family protein [Rahnella sp. BCC 1045]